MATFPSISPSFTISKSSSPKTRVSSMGDGYELRVTVGLNQNPKKWDLQFNYLTTTNAATIETFLDERAKDGASFTWSPPDTTISYKWVCDSWQKEIPYPNRVSITASFRQVFEA